MHTFANIAAPAPDLTLWWWLAIPVVAAVAFFFMETWVNRVTDKWFGRPFVGVGFVLMGISMLTGVSSVPIIQDVIETKQAQTAAAELEANGFQEVRLTLETVTFGAYYNGELLRGILIADSLDPGTLRVVQTPPPAPN